MSFVGQLSQFPLTDLMQMIATTGKTGRLSLTQRDGKGVIIFRGGKIIYAASTTVPRETLGSALICEQLITREGLDRGVGLWEQENRERRLGEILIELGLVAPDDLARVIQQQIEKVILEFMEWERGFFKFELLNLPEGIEVEVDAEDFLLDDGVGTDHVLLSIAVQLDELEKDAAHAEGRPGEARQADEPDAESVAGAGLRDHALTDLSPLKSMMRDVRSPEFTGEVTSQLLEYARKLFRRGALFVVHQRYFDGMAGFGIGDEEGRAAATVRGITVPAGQPSILREVTEKNESYCGPLPFLPVNQDLLKALGGGEPSEVAAVPLSVNGRVVLVFYGDNLPDDTPIGPLAELELLMLQMGLAMEKQLLAKRVEELEVFQHLLHRG